MPMEKDSPEQEELDAAFRIVCRKCGGEDVRLEMDNDEGCDSGFGPSVTLTCRACQKSYVTLRP